MSTPISKEQWASVAPYVIPPAAAAIAIVPAFRDLMIKSAQQQGNQNRVVTLTEGVREGIKKSPTVGSLVGTQMILQNRVEKRLITNYGFEKSALSTALVSSCVVGAISSPLLAIFNGQTMGSSWKHSLKNLSCKQTCAFAAQETGFVGGLSIADRLSVVMRKKLGDNKVVDCSSAYISGAAGSLVGHPANTAITRWQSPKQMKVENFRQLWWGAARKSHAIGVFATVFKLGKDAMNSTVQK